jgi:hypothetical protein
VSAGKTGTPVTVILMTVISETGSKGTGLVGAGWTETLGKTGWAEAGPWAEPGAGIALET